MVVLTQPPAQIQSPPIVPDLSGALLVPVYTTGIIVLGIVLALFIALRNTASTDRAAIIRAVAELFRWFRRGGPTGSP